jgi:hypothetical protein
MGLDMHNRRTLANEVSPRYKKRRSSSRKGNPNNGVPG